MIAGFYPLTMSEYERDMAVVEQELIPVINELSHEGKERLLRLAQAIARRDQSIGKPSCAR